MTKKIAESEDSAPASTTGGIDNGVVGKIAGAAATVAAAKIGQLVLDKGWRLATGRKPPKDASNIEHTVGEVVLWGVVSGAGIALVRALAQRGTARFFKPSAKASKTPKD